MNIVPHMLTRTKACLHVVVWWTRGEGELGSTFLPSSPVSPPRASTEHNSGACYAKYRNAPRVPWDSRWGLLTSFSRGTFDILSIFVVFFSSRVRQPRGVGEGVTEGGGGGGDDRALRELDPKGKAVSRSPLVWNGDSPSDRAAIRYIIEEIVQSLKIIQWISLYLQSLYW